MNKEEWGEKLLHKFTKKFLLVNAVFIFFIGGLVYGMAKPVTVIPAEGSIVYITVKQGMTADDIGKLLYEKGIINNVFTFRLFARMHSMESSLKAGEYSFSPAMSTNEIVARLSAGGISERQLTIPEGYTVEQIAKLLKEKNIGDPEKFKNAARKNPLYPGDPSNSKNIKFEAEGFIFPDTYKISSNTTEEQLLEIMMREFNNKFTPAMKERAKELGLTVRDIIILASLVEKEAQIDQDRPVIAGVFLNRLKQGMPLQSCATIQYILGYPKPELTVQDTEIVSPYNTYQHVGLPPGPIANPGIASIRAALYPEKTDYLYFVADKQGKHHFSRTYGEHLAFIDQVQK